MPDTFRDYMARCGFLLTNQGGGCMAYEHNEPDGSYALITIPDDPSAPESDAEPVVMGIYDREGWSLSFQKFPNASAAVAAYAELQD